MNPDHKGIPMSDLVDEDLESFITELIDQEILDAIADEMDKTRDAVLLKMLQDHDSKKPKSYINAFITTEEYKDTKELEEQLEVNRILFNMLNQNIILNQKYPTSVATYAN